MIKPRLRHKYNAKKCEFEVKKFRSKLEKSVYLALRMLKEKGQILFILREVPVELPGSIKHYIDFFAFGKEECWLIEAKSKEGRAPVGEIKRKQAEEILGVTIHVVTEPKEVFSLISPEC